MADLLALSTRIIDEGVLDEPVNRVTNELSELDSDLAVVESFSHSIAWRTEAGLVSFDASGVHTGAAVVAALRNWTNAPFSHLVYTHGHADHVGGSGWFARDATDRGAPLPIVIGHENVPRRIARYELTSDWNLHVNNRQFGGVRGDLELSVGDTGSGIEVPAGARRFLPRDVMACDTLVEEHASIGVGDEVIELHHARGETDDHLWGYVPSRRWLMTGDFVIWNFPNAGNPQKVQRYPLEWAGALRDMAATGAELLLPAHGLPISGRDRIATVLLDIAGTLERLVADVLERMNAGATLDEIVHEVKVPHEQLAKPYLRPFYDEPEFVIRNVWRLYGGWWDGAPSRLKPAPDHHLATVIAGLTGGTAPLVTRALEAADTGDMRVACHLVDLAAWAAPDDPEVHAVRADVYLRRRKAETSLMAKGIYAAAARESQLVVDDGRP